MLIDLWDLYWNIIAIDICIYMGLVVCCLQRNSGVMAAVLCGLFLYAFLGLTASVYIEESVKLVEKPNAINMNEQLHMRWESHCISHMMVATIMFWSPDKRWLSIKKSFVFNLLLQNGLVFCLGLRNYNSDISQDKWTDEPIRVSLSIYHNHFHEFDSIKNQQVEL